MLHSVLTNNPISVKIWLDNPAGYGGNRMKNIEKAILAAICGSFLAFCLFVMIFGAYANHVEQQERAEREAVRQAV